MFCTRRVAMFRRIFLRWDNNKEDHMKRYSSRFFFFILLILLCSCNYSIQPSIDNSPTTSSSSADSSLLPITLPSNAYILNFCDDDILFCQQTNDEDSMSQTLYHYRISTKKTTQLCEFSLPNMCGELSVLNKNTLYLLDGNNILMIDISSGASSILAQLDSKSCYSSIALSTNNLILHSILENSEGLTYLIEAIHLPDGARHTITRSHYKDGIGTAISCITTENDDIYTYEVIISPLSTKYQIVLYNVDGTCIAHYSLDMTDFIPETNTIAQDSVVSIQKRNNCYILSTINSRTKIFAQNSNILQSLSIPNALFCDFPGNYHTLPQDDSSFPYIYLTPNSNDLPIFCVNTNDLSISEIHISRVPSAYSTTWYRSTKSSLLFHPTSSEETNDNDSPFFIFDAS